jgi:hypothetical protein
VPHPTPPTPPSFWQGKIRKNSAVWYIYIYISQYFFNKIISNISLLKEFVDHPNSEKKFRQLFATGRTKFGKKLEIFYKENAKYLENRQTLKTTKLGERKTLHPNHERYHAFEFAMNL